MKNIKFCILFFVLFNPNFGVLFDSTGVRTSTAYDRKGWFLVNYLVVHKESEKSTLAAIRFAGPPDSKTQPTIAVFVFSP